MSKLFLTLAFGDYDRTRPLADGRVQAEGLDLNWAVMTVEEIFHRMAAHAEFDASEMSLSSYTIARSQGDERFIAIPIFPSRTFRHNAFWVNPASGIAKPQDLVGKRLGVPEYQFTAAIWGRGLLQHEYGVPPEAIRWFQGGQETPGRRERIPIKIPAGVSVESIGPERTLNAMMEAGELDAVFVTRLPKPYLQGSPHFRRLFPNYRDVERDYFRRTGLFPIMHTVVIRREIYDRHPWVAFSLYKAFRKAKDEAYHDMYESSALKVTLPWLLPEIEETRALMGKDPWPYGIEPNRKPLTTFLGYLHEQGLTSRLMTIEEIFAAPTVDDYRT